MARALPFTNRALDALNGGGSPVLSHLSSCQRQGRTCAGDSPIASGAGSDYERVYVEDKQGLAGPSIAKRTHRR